MLPLITDLNSEGQLPLATFQLDFKALKIDVLFDTTQYITIYSLKSLLTFDPRQKTVGWCYSQITPSCVLGHPNVDVDAAIFKAYLCQCKM